MESRTNRSKGTAGLGYKLNLTDGLSGTKNTHNECHLSCSSKTYKKSSILAGSVIRSQEVSPQEMIEKKEFIEYRPL